jgi:hypothetical protein
MRNNGFRVRRGRFIMVDETADRPPDESDGENAQFDARAGATSRRRVLSGAAALGVGNLVMGRASAQAETPTGEQNTFRVAKGDQPDGIATYVLAVDGSISPRDDFDGTACLDQSPQYVTGQVGPVSGSDSVEYSGAVVSADVYGPAEILVNGQQRSPESLASGLANTLVVSKGVAPGDTASFEVSVSGVLAPGPDIEDANQSTNCGQIQNQVGPDNQTGTVHFAGEVTNFSADGAVTLQWGEDDGNGNGSGNGRPEFKRLEVTKEGEPTGEAVFEVTVSGEIRPTDSLERDGRDSISGNSATMVVGPRGGSDAIEFSGDIVDESLDGPAKVFEDGERRRIDGEAPEEFERLEVTKAGAPRGEAVFEVTVDGEIRATDSLERDGRDSISGNSATMVVGPRGGTDAIEFSGDIVDSSLDGPARVLRNGSEIDPETLG